MYQKSIIDSYKQKLYILDKSLFEVGFLNKLQFGVVLFKYYSILAVYVRGCQILNH